MNYTSRYGLEFNPFIKNSKDVLVETNDYKEHDIQIELSCTDKRIGVLTGGPGRGKTTMIRHWSRVLINQHIKLSIYPCQH